MRMTAILDINALLGYLNDQTINKTTNLYMITRKKENDEFVYNVLTAETHNEVAEQLNDIIINHLNKMQNQNKEFRDYDIDDSTNEYVQYINQNDVPAAGNKIGRASCRERV